MQCCNNIATDIQYWLNVVFLLFMLLYICYNHTFPTLYLYCLCVVEGRWCNVATTQLQIIDASVYKPKWIEIKHCTYFHDYPYHDSLHNTVRLVVQIHRPTASTKFLNEKTAICSSRVWKSTTFIRTWFSDQSLK
jgi:hypothetical protein